MHEYSVASSLLELVEKQAREHAAERVVAVHVRIGALSGVEPDLLRTAWELVRERSLAAGAALRLEAVPARWACSRCAAPVAPGLVLRCADCGEPGRLAAGDELLLARIEMEVA